METGNLFDGLPTALVDERFDVLAKGGEFVLERILSTGQSTPPGEWLAESRDEWVVLLAGNATLRFEDEPTNRNLASGDFLHIAAHRRHRVVATSARPACVWLAIHYVPQRLRLDEVRSDEEPSP